MAKFTKMPPQVASANIRAKYKRSHTQNDTDMQDDECVVISDIHVDQSSSGFAVPDWKDPVLERNPSSIEKQQQHPHSNTTSYMEDSKYTSPKKSKILHKHSHHDETDSVPKSGSSSDSRMIDMLGHLTSYLERNNSVMNDMLNVLGTLNLQGRGTKSDTSRSVSLSSHKSSTGQEKVMVEARATFLKITDIDTVTQQFEAEIFIQAKWQEPALKNIAIEDLKDFDIKNYWDPKLTVLNCDGEPLLNRKSYKVRFAESGYQNPLIYQFWRLKGFFRENLELEHFPVDVQDLTISISTERSIEQIHLIEDQSSLGSVNVNAFMDAQEWKIYKHVESFKDITTVEYASSTVHPILHVQCRVSRKIGYFMWNIVFIMLMIVSLAFSTFSIEPGSADRLAVTITLFLTAVAFKLVVKQSLPTISYLTYLDIYVLASLMFLALNAAGNSIMSYIANTAGIDVAAGFDVWSIVTLILVLVIFHLIFGVYIMLTALKRRRVMEDKDRLYEAKKYLLDKHGVLVSTTSSLILATTSVSKK
ncbi:hypothetical protein ScPMuIL_000727 [Solemya velum]